MPYKRLLPPLAQQDRAGDTDVAGAGFEAPVAVQFMLSEQWRRVNLERAEVIPLSIPFHCNITHNLWLQRRLGYRTSISSLFKDISDSRVYFRSKLLSDKMLDVKLSITFFHV